MQPYIKMSSLWHDDDMWELRLQVHDGQNSFTTDIYIGHQDKEAWILQLKRFSTQVHGGLLNLQFGMFGPEYGGGAMQLRFHFLAHKKIHLSVHGQSVFFEFGKNNVARESKLYLLVEPAQLDQFIRALEDFDPTKHGKIQLSGNTI